MLLPGIVGEFMFVIPFVVAVGLVVSLVEAFWILLLTPFPLRAACQRIETTRASGNVRRVGLGAGTPKRCAM